MGRLVVALTFLFIGGFMRIILIMCLALVSCFTFADPLIVAPVVDEPAFDIVSLLVGLLGEKSVYVLVAIAVIGFVWAQLRQLISAETLAKLPNWVVWLLELLAANKGRASNAINNQPEHYKKWVG
tara:strand:+ start:23082 stop:23459 length:378 start_codon:yes stop_codon:yes gene_type:complete